jgi:predicted SnoaL-like aldol condensation-catalyzing enzyme
MSEANRTVLRRVFLELFNEHRLELVPELYTEDYVALDPANRVQMSGHQALIDLVTAYRTNFPEHRYELHELVAEGEIVCARWSVFPNSDKMRSDYKVDGLSHCAYSGGRISKVWQQWDTLGFLQEVGAVSLDVSVAAAIKALIASE